jgi:hypothetical protein
MKLIKPLIIALIVSSLDFSYRYFRYLQPDIYFFVISFLVFFTLFTVLIDYEES